MNYVVWDTSILPFLSSYLRRGLGSAATIGVYILAGLFGVLIAIVLVRRFFRG